MEMDSLSVTELLEVLEDLLDNAKNAPFSSKALVDRDAMYDVLKDIRLFLPNEIKQSKWVMDERNKILIDAEQKAEEIIKDSEVRAAKLVKDNEIVKQAEREAEFILEDARKVSKEMRLGAMEYVDSLLVDVAELFDNAYAEVKLQNNIIEEHYTQKISELFENRRELRESTK